MKSENWEARELPEIIQGGMGIGISGYELARAVSMAGGLGVVSGTAIDAVFARRLREPGTKLDAWRALERFPFPVLARTYARKFEVEVEGEAKYRLLSLPGLKISFERKLAFVLGAFVEVTLAKEGHDAPVGMNLLEKIQLPTLPTLFGAMLGGLDVLLMGAGVPTAIPGVLDALSRFESVRLALHVEGAGASRKFESEFEPAAFLEECRVRELSLGGVPREAMPPRRPLFLSIVSSDILARRILKVASGRVDGFVVEHHRAGGHNAPPRRPGSDGKHNELDEPKLAVFRELGVPFWLAGGLAHREGVEQAKASGAAGIQLGTVFAFCEESGLTAALKTRVLGGLRKGTIRVETDLEASPTGYPFKVVVDDENPRERTEQRARPRVCDLGYLRQAYVDADGVLGFRCPGEPEETFVKKGGDRALTVGKLCLCNQLLASIGLGQKRGEVEELPLLTAGDEIEQVLSFAGTASSYSARSVVRALLGRENPEASGQVGFPHEIATGV